MSSYPDVFITGAARTPIGKFLGGLSSLKAPALGAIVCVREDEDRDLSPGNSGEWQLGRARNKCGH